MKNFVFDLYGTLVDIRTDESSQKFKDKFSKYLTKNYGAGVTFFDKFTEALKAYEGFREPDMVRVMCDAIIASGGTITYEKGESAAKVWRKLSTHKLKLYRGARKLLINLKSNGARVYLLSNAQAAFTVPELKKLKIYELFDGIELSSDFGEKKPSPAFFKHIADKYNLKLSETVFTGNDISCDIVPSKNAGMCAVYIKSEISPASDSLAAASMSDFAFDSFSAMAEKLITLSKDLNYGNR